VYLSVQFSRSIGLDRDGGKSGTDAVHVTGGVVPAFPEVVSLWPCSSAPRRLLWYRNVTSAAQGDDPFAAWLLLQVEGETNPENKQTAFLLREFAPSERVKKMKSFTFFTFRFGKQLYLRQVRPLESLQGLTRTVARRTSAEVGSASLAAAVAAAAADFAAAAGRRHRTCTCRPTQTGSGGWRSRSEWRPGQSASDHAECRGESAMAG
jgi:hypothetical protein